jgi:ketosteroid isomerase-like protein
MPDRAEASSAVETIRRLWMAQSHGQIEEMLAYIHPDVRWRPLTRPARSLYVGHAGTLDMLADLRASMGEFRMEWEELREQPDGNVIGVGHPVLLTDQGEVAGPQIEGLIEMRDGLVAGLDSRPVGDEPD